MGRHPRRTPFYGTVLMIAALITGLWVHDVPTPALRVIAYVLLFLVAAAGFLLTFRDYS